MDKVHDGSPAQAAGVLPGDILFQINWQEAVKRNKKKIIASGSLCTFAAKGAPLLPEQRYGPTSNADRYGVFDLRPEPIKTTAFTLLKAAPVGEPIELTVKRPTAMPTASDAVKCEHECELQA